MAKLKLGVAVMVFGQINRVPSYCPGLGRFWKNNDHSNKFVSTICRISLEKCHKKKQAEI